jgi:hypothetical protein
VLTALDVACVVSVAASYQQENAMTCYLADGCAIRAYDLAAQIFIQCGVVLPPVFIEGTESGDLCSADGDPWRWHVALLYVGPDLLPYVIDVALPQCTLDYPVWQGTFTAAGAPNPTSWVGQTGDRLPGDQTLVYRRCIYTVGGIFRAEIEICLGDPLSPPQMCNDSLVQDCIDDRTKECLAGVAACGPPPLNEQNPGRVCEVPPGLCPSKP